MDTTLNREEVTDPVVAVGVGGRRRLEVFVDQGLVFEAFSGDVFQAGLEVEVVHLVHLVAAGRFKNPHRDHEILRLTLQAADLLLGGQRLRRPELLLLLRRHSAIPGTLLLHPDAAEPFLRLAELPLHTCPLPLAGLLQLELRVLQPALRVGEHRAQLREVLLRVRRQRLVLDDLLQGVVAPLVRRYQAPAGLGAGGAALRVGCGPQLPRAGRLGVTDGAGRGEGLHQVPDELFRDELGPVEVVAPRRAAAAEPVRQLTDRSAPGQPHQEQRQLAAGRLLVDLALWRHRTPPPPYRPTLTTR